MTWRTPSSLKWLIVKRSRISGLIGKLVKEQIALTTRLEEVSGKILRLEGQLLSLDETFELHEVKVEPGEIAPVGPQQRPKILPHGQMTRILLKAMRAQGSWVSTSVLMEAVSSAAPQTEVLIQERYLNRAVRRRLGNLLRKGRVERLLDNISHHDGASEALWRIPEDR